MHKIISINTTTLEPSSKRKSFHPLYTQNLRTKLQNISRERASSYTEPAMDSKKDEINEMIIDSLKYLLQNTLTLLKENLARTEGKDTETYKNYFETLERFFPNLDKKELQKKAIDILNNKQSPELLTILKDYLKKQPSLWGTVTQSLLKNEAHENELLNLAWDSLLESPEKQNNYSFYQVCFPNQSPFFLPILKLDNPFDGHKENNVLEASCSLKEKKTHNELNKTAKNILLHSFRISSLTLTLEDKTLITENKEKAAKMFQKHATMIASAYFDHALFMLENAQTMGLLKWIEKGQNLEGYKVEYEDKVWIVNAHENNNKDHAIKLKTEQTTEHITITVKNNSEVEIDKKKIDHPNQSLRFEKQYTILVTKSESFVQFLKEKKIKHTDSDKYHHTLVLEYMQVLQKEKKQESNDTMLNDLKKKLIPLIANEIFDEKEFLLSKIEKNEDITIAGKRLRIAQKTKAILGAIYLKEKWEKFSHQSLETLITQVYQTKTFRNNPGYTLFLVDALLSFYQADNNCEDCNDTNTNDMKYIQDKIVDIITSGPFSIPDDKKETLKNITSSFPQKDKFYLEITLFERLHNRAKKLIKSDYADIVETFSKELLNKRPDVRQLLQSLQEDQSIINPNELIHEIFLGNAENNTPSKQLCNTKKETLKKQLKSIWEIAMLSTIQKISGVVSHSELDFIIPDLLEINADKYTYTKTIPSDSKAIYKTYLRKAKSILNHCYQDPNFDLIQNSDETEEESRHITSYHKHLSKYFLIMLSLKPSLFKKDLNKTVASLKHQLNSALENHRKNEHVETDRAKTAYKDYINNHIVETGLDPFSQATKDILEVDETFPAFLENIFPTFDRYSKRNIGCLNDLLSFIREFEHNVKNLSVTKLCPKIKSEFQQNSKQNIDTILDTPFKKLSNDAQDYLKKQESFKLSCEKADSENKSLRTILLTSLNPYISIATLDPIFPNLLFPKSEVYFTMKMLQAKHPELTTKDIMFLVANDFKDIQRDVEKKYQEIKTRIKKELEKNTDQKNLKRFEEYTNILMRWVLEHPEWSLFHTQRYHQFNNQFSKIGRAHV